MESMHTVHILLSCTLVDCLNGTLTLYNHMYDSRLYCGSNFRGLVLEGPVHGLKLSCCVAFVLCKIRGIKISVNTPQIQL